MCTPYRLFFVPLGEFYTLAKFDWPLTRHPSRIKHILFMMSSGESPAFRPKDAPNFKDNLGGPDCNSDEILCGVTLK